MICSWAELTFQSTSGVNTGNLIDTTRACQLRCASCPYFIAVIPTASDDRVSQSGWNKSVVKVNDGRWVEGEPSFLLEPRLPKVLLKSTWPPRSLSSTHSSLYLCVCLQGGFGKLLRQRTCSRIRRTSIIHGNVVAKDKVVSFIACSTLTAPIETRW